MLLSLIVNIILIPINIVLLVVKLPLKILFVKDMKLWITYGSKEVTVTGKAKR